MVDVVSKVRFIQQKGTAIQALVPPTEWSDFLQEFREIERLLQRNGDVQSAENDLHSLLSRHGTVAALLHDAEPAIFPLPQPMPPPTNQGARSAKGSTQSTPGEAVAPEGSGEGGPPPEQNSARASKWTPEESMSLYKEIVTALFALIIIGFTSWLAVRTLLYAGDPGKISDAKDILTVMIGLAGTVIGYYFGRVPADARAAESGRQANAAVVETERARATGRAVSQQLDTAITAATTSAVSRSAEMDQVQAQLEMMRRARDQLRGIAD